MLVQDIYGGAHQTLGLGGSLIASSFGKSAMADRGTCSPQRPLRAARPLAARPCPAAPACAPPEFSKEDMAKSLLHMISNDIGQLACLYARLHGLDRVYFGGFFIRGHPVTMRTITYSINFFSKVTPRAPGAAAPPDPPRRSLACPPALPDALAPAFHVLRTCRPKGRGAQGRLFPDPCPFALVGSSTGRRGRLRVGRGGSGGHAGTISPVDELSSETSFLPRDSLGWAFEWGGWVGVNFVEEAGHSLISPNAKLLTSALNVVLWTSASRTFREASAA